MTTHANGPLSFLTAALLAGASLAGLGVCPPAAAQDPEPRSSDEPSPTKQEDPHQALPLKRTLPKINLAALTAEESQVSVQRPIAQGRLQVIYVFSCASVEDSSWLQRALRSDHPGVRTTLEHMQRLAELQTFKGRVAWSAIAVPGYPKASLPAGYGATPEDGAKTDREPKADQKPQATPNAAHQLATRTFLRKLRSQTGAEFPFLIDVKGELVPALRIRSNLVLIADSKGVIQFAATERATMKVGDSSRNMADSDYLRRALNELLDGHAEVSFPYGKEDTQRKVPQTNEDTNDEE